MGIGKRCDATALSTTCSRVALGVSTPCARRDRWHDFLDFCAEIRAIALHSGFHGSLTRVFSPSGLSHFYFFCNTSCKRIVIIKCLHERFFDFCRKSRKNQSGFVQDFRCSYIGTTNYPFFVQFLLYIFIRAESKYLAEYILFQCQHLKSKF